MKGRTVKANLSVSQEPGGHSVALLEYEFPGHHALISESASTPSDAVCAAFNEAADTIQRTEAAKDTLRAQWNEAPPPVEPNAWGRF